MKYFVVSDIHSFYIEFKNALKDAGFDKKNKNHTLVILGDLFDRGPDALSIYKFISSIPKKRCILVRGNHELLYKELLEKDYPESHDFHNHTVDTFCQIARTKQLDFDCIEGYFEKNSYYQYFSLYRGWEDADDNPEGDLTNKHWKQVLEIVKNHPITKLILDDKRWVNYFELDKYIMVHSWIPCATKFAMLDPNCPPEEIGYREDWKNATQTEWGDATWGCPWAKAKKGWNKTGKTIVCGHWHVADFYKHLKNIKNTGSFITKIYYSKDVIGIDCGVYVTSIGAYYHPQNVLIIEDGVCYNKYHVKLEEYKAVSHIETVTVK